MRHKTLLTAATLKRRWITNSPATTWFLNSNFVGEKMEQVGKYERPLTRRSFPNSLPTNPLCQWDESVENKKLHINSAQKACKDEGLSQLRARDIIYIYRKNILRSNHARLSILVPTLDRLNHYQAPRRRPDHVRSPPSNL